MNNTPLHVLANDETGHSAGWRYVPPDLHQRTARAVQALMDAAGLDDRQLAELLDGSTPIRASLVRHWREGRAPVPGWVLVGALMLAGPGGLAILAEAIR